MRTQSLRAHRAHGEKTEICKQEESSRQKPALILGFQPSEKWNWFLSFKLWSGILLGSLGRLIQFHTATHARLKWTSLRVFKYACAPVTPPSPVRMEDICSNPERSPLPSLRDVRPDSYLHKLNFAIVEWNLTICALSFWFEVLTLTPCFLIFIHVISCVSILFIYIAE